MALLTGRARRLARLACLVIALAVGAAHAQAPTRPNREAEIKAVFLFNFAQFVEWPADAFAAPAAPLVIGVLGEDPFGRLLHDVVRGERIGGRPLEVRPFARPEEIDRCHILFISSSEAPRLEAVLAALKGRSILTVSDGEGFAVRGVMIRFLTERSRIRLRINLGAAKATGLVISSKLLRPAEIVGERED